ncbi:hypothetical protein L9F63_010979, partial [Diploptera punctata]
DVGFITRNSRITSDLTSQINNELGGFSFKNRVEKVMSVSTTVREKSVKCRCRMLMQTEFLNN